MKVINGLENLLENYDNLALALGTFDGIHRGHQELIKATVKKAKEQGGKSMVLTFSEHPKKVFHGIEKNILINTHREKIHLLKNLGIDIVLFAHFTEEFKNLSEKEFVIDILKKKIGAKFLFAGFNYTFGKGRKGKVDLLTTLGKELGMEVNIINPVKAKDTVISSTVIRELIQNGEIEKATDYLGGPIVIIGEVEHGRKIGRTMGFPTANLKVFNRIYPPTGIYGVKVMVEGETTIREGLMNIGYNPTIICDDKKISVEVHILDFNQDIYDKELVVSIVKYLRPEKKCDDLDSLKELIKSDVAKWREYLKEQKDEV